MKESVISQRFKSILGASTAAMGISYVLVLSECIIAGQLLGEEAVAAIALVAPLIPFLQFVGEMIASGTFALISYARGKGDSAEADALFSQAMILSVGAGLLLTVLLVAFREQILSYWDVDANLMEYASAYYAGVMVRPIIAFVQLFLMPLLLIEGEERLDFISSVVQLISGLVLEICLGQIWGLFGISLATTISLALAGTIEAGYLLSKHCQLHFCWHVSLAKVCEVFRLSFCFSLPSLLLTLLPFVITGYIIEHFDERFLVIFTMINTLLNLAVSLFYGIDDVIQAMVCIYLAEKNLAGVKKVMRLSFLAALAEGLAMGAILIAFGGQMPSLFGIDDPLLVPDAVLALRLYGIFTAFLLWEMTYAFYCTYIGEARASMLFLFLALFAFPVLSIWLLGGMFGLGGIWAGLGAGALLTLPVNFLFVRWREKHGTGKGLLLLDSARLASQLSYDIKAVQEDVLGLVRQVEEDLAAWGLPEAKYRKAAFFVEELGMDTVERAAGNPLYLEVTLTKGEPLEIIIRDNGECANIIDENERVSSFRMFIVSQTASRLPYASFVLAGGENRTVLYV